MNYSVCGSGIVLIISLLILIWVIQNKKEKKNKKIVKIQVT